MDEKELRASRRLHQRRAKTNRDKAAALSKKARFYRLKAAANKRVAVRRTKQIQKLASSGGAGSAVKWALAQVGTTEHPYGSNWGPKISDWIKATGYGSGVPWCQCFVNAAAVHGGAVQCRSGYTPAVLNLSAAPKGWKRVSSSEARAGDMVFFKWPGVSSASCDHVGMLTGPVRNGVAPTVEGNTSPGNGGSQNNGGGVFARSRPTAYVAGYVRPAYK